MPSRLEIDHHAIKLIVGIIAISLAFLTSVLSGFTIESISASYHDDGAARNIFVGFLFAIAAFMFAYNGNTGRELVMAKVASIAALGVALFPCDCGGHVEIVPYVHGFSAAVMFVILALFCRSFYKRAMAKIKEHPRARLRAGIYAFCGWTIVAVIAVLGFDQVSGGVISDRVARLTFYGEAAGLVAFGFAWLMASRVLPVFTDVAERVRLIPQRT